MPAINVILISGHSGSGKGHVAFKMKQLIETDGDSVELLSFADPVKEISGKILNNCYNPKSEFSVPEMKNLGYKESEHSDLEFCGKPLRIRDMLIFVGMEMRKHKDTIWADIALEKIKMILEDKAENPPKYFIFDDNRFINETQVLNVTNINGTPVNFIGIRVSRPDGQIVQGSNSENEIDLIEKSYDYIRINNTGSLDDLNEDVASVYKKIKHTIKNPAMFFTDGEFGSVISRIMHDSHDVNNNLFGIDDYVGGSDSESDLESDSEHDTELNDD